VSARAPGQTASAGWEVGVRKTFAVTPERAWETVVTPPGLNVWLGTDADFSAVKGYRFQTREGTTGEVRSAEEGRLLRLTWRPAGVSNDSTVQIRVLPAAGGATVSIHHERLGNAEEREQMREHWREVLGELGRLAQALG
jgi:uncharacterized protein YndB with AHSA1/START domain